MNELHAEEMLLDFDGWLGRQPEDVRSGIQQHLNAVPEAGRVTEKQRLASMYTVSEQTGLDLGEINERWDAIRGGYAEIRETERLDGHWAKVKDDEEQFFHLMAEEASKLRNERVLLQGEDKARMGDTQGDFRQASRKNSLAFRATDAALDGKSYADALSEWEAAVRAKDGYDESRASMYAEVAATQHQKVSETVRKVSPIANEAFDRIAAARSAPRRQLVRDADGNVRLEFAPSESDTTPFALFRGLNPEEKSVAFELMLRRAKREKAGEDKPAAQVIAERFGRSFEDFFGRATPGERLDFLAKRPAFKEGDLVEYGDPKDDLMAEWAAHQSDNGAGSFGTPPLLRQKSRRLTAEEAARYNRALAEQIEDVTTAEQLRKLGQGVIDPADSSNFLLKKIILPAVDSAALLTAFSLPGMTVPALKTSARSYQVEEYMRLVEEFPDADRRELNSLAEITGLAQAGLDKLEVLALGRLGSTLLPNVSRTLRGFAITGSRAARLGVNTGATLLLETGIELTQDHIIPALVRDNLANDPRFDVSWGDVWSDVAASAPDVALGMLLMSGLGGLSQTHQQSRHARTLREFTGSAGAMRARGYSLDQIGEIQAAPLAERGELLARYLPPTAPTGADAAKLRAEAVALARAESETFGEKKRVETVATADALSSDIRVTRSASGWWVQFGDKSVQVESAEAARRIREDLNQAASEKEAEALVSIIDNWHSNTEASTTRETTLTGDLLTVGDGDVMRNGEATQELSARDSNELSLEIERLPRGDTVYSIDGINRVSLAEKTAEGARRVVQRLEINRSPSAVLTFLHESIEADFRAGVARGSISEAEAQRAIASIANAFDPRRARDAEERAFRESVQRIARGEANSTDLRETLTELAVADVLGRRRDDTAFPAGSVTAALNAAALNATDAAAVREIGKLRAFLRAVRQYFRSLFGTIAALRKARREGVAADFDTLITRITGQTEQLDYDREAAAEAEAIAAAAAGDLDYTPPTDDEMEAGIAFRIGRATALPSPETRVFPTESGVLIGPAAFSLRAFHGTPHKVDRFSTEKIGIGEGNQVYGWGLYFAEEKAVADQYASELSARMGDEEEIYLEVEEDASPVERKVAGYLRSRHGNPYMARRLAESEQAPAEVVSALRALEKPSSGNTYTVELDVEPDELLDWDKPSAEWPLDLQNAVARAAWRVDEKKADAAYSRSPNDLPLLIESVLGFDGGQVYQKLHQHFGSAQRASEYLDSIGIPGIRYFDAGSRDGKGGTYNYVIFDESRIRITHENGALVDLGAAFALRQRDATTLQEVAAEAGKSGNSRAWAELPLPQDQREEIARLTGEDLTNFVRIIDASAVRHIEKRHGPGTKEEAPVTGADIEALPEIIATPGVTALAGETTKSVETIISVHYYNGWYYIAEEVRTGVNALAVVTLRKSAKRIGQAQADSAEAAGPYTSETILREAKERLDRAVAEFNSKRGRAFRVTAGSRLELIQKRLDRALARDPERRREIGRRAAEKLEQLRVNWETERVTANADRIRPIVEKRTPAELDKEQAMRQALRREELEAEVYGRFSKILDDETLTSVWSGPVMSYLSRPSSRLHGRLMSKSAALRRYAEAQGYDGIDGIPPFVFGGTLRPDEAAQELYEAGLIPEPSPDRMWDAIRGELAAVKRLQESLKSAKGQLGEAREKAREEAAAWREEQDAMQKRDWSGRARLIRDLRTLDAILSVLPPEIRGKVGGFVKLAQLGSDDARAAEIGRRVEKIAALLETHLQAETTTAIRELLERAAPKHEAGKQSRGKLGAEAHRYFDQVASVMDLSEDEVEQRRAAIEKGYEAADLTTEQAADLFEQEQILDTFGAWEKKSAADMDAALRSAQEVYNTGRNRWRTAEEARLAEVAALAESIVETLGTGGYAGSQRQKQQKGAVRRAAGKLGLDLKSFAEVLEALLGRDHPVARRWSDAARDGFTERNDELRAVRRRWREVVERATGEKGIRAQRELWAMAHEQTITAHNAGDLVGSTETVPLTIVDQWREGTADPAALGYSREEADVLIAQREAIADDDMREGLPISRATRKPETVRMTEAEAIFLTMLGQQEQYTAALNRAGWTDDVLVEVEGQISAAGIGLRQWLRNEYRDNYRPLAAVFERMYGVALPQIRNYAPAAFYHVGAERDTGPEERGGIATGMRAGFLRNRKEHTAAPRLENAFATFHGHASQTAHWKALAEVVREVSGVLGKPEVKRAIEAAHGPEMLKTLSDWLRNIEGNGLQTQSGTIDRALSWITSQQAYIALAFRLGTLAKQSTAVLGAAYRMPAGAYARGFVRLVTGRLDVRAIFNSPAIQRRLETGFAPEVRAALNDVWLAKPSLRARALEKGMELIGLTDAIFTTGSAAIAYDYHLREAEKAGLTGQAAETAAMREMEDIVARTAQPADVVNRSLFEARQNAFGRLLFMFASEARQKSSLWLTAWQKTVVGKATADDYRVLAISHLVVAPMLQTITAAWRDLRDDDDDEVFDAENWDPLDYLKAVVAGPLAGIPLVSDAISGFPDNGIFGRQIFAWKALTQLFEGPKEREVEKVEWYMDRIFRVMQGLDAFTGVLGSVGDQAVSLVDNAFTDDDEREKQERKRRNRERRESRDENDL